MSNKKPSRAIVAARDLRGSPLGNLLLEDAAAAKEHGRITARVGIGPDGNPVVYSTDKTTREAVVQAIQQRNHVDYMDIPEVTERDFRKLLRDGTAALDESHAALPSDANVTPVSRPPSPFSPDEYRSEVEAVLVERFAVERDEAAMLVRRYDRGVSEYHHKAKAPELAAVEIQRRTRSGS